MIIRKIALTLLRASEFDFRINHHWFPGRKILLNSYLHKGYWFHGKKRETGTMEAFAKILREGDSVLEVGAHIGYITSYFSHLVGPGGEVVAFEPGLNNLPYLKENIRGLSNVVVQEKGVGAQAGQLEFYEESLTGQNNSFVKGFKPFEGNSRAAYVSSKTLNRLVEIVSLDDYFQPSNRIPDFIKIDVEGFELEVLKGSTRVLDQLPVLMVEVQLSHDEIFSIFKTRGYDVYNEKGEKLSSPQARQLNLFCLHPEKHAIHLKALNWN
jgi:FkbM family methyltransferase